MSAKQVLRIKDEENISSFGFSTLSINVFTEKKSLMI
jgi:hypothetical protein